MLYHYDARDYDVAASEAAALAREKLEGLIAKGREEGVKLIETLEGQIINDYECRASKLQFKPHETFGLTALADKQEFRLHRHALGQMLTDGDLPVKMPRQYLDGLLAVDHPWARELAADNLNRLMYQNPSKRRLRVVEQPDMNELRGYVTPSFAPRDIPTLIQAFTTACQKYGALPFEGKAWDTKFHIRAILPHVFEPVPNEVLAFYVHFGDSEFGNGATTLSLGIMRLWCTNKAMMDNVMRSVHLTRNSPDFDWSKDTIKAMTVATQKQLRDSMMHVLEPGSVNKYLDVIKKANDQKIDPNQLAGFLKKHCSKSEVDGITRVFNEGDVEMLPVGQTRYRLSNAISFFAHDVKTERSEELERLAGMALAA